MTQVPSNHYEVERKFIMLRTPDLPILERHVVRQAYLYVDDNVEIRITVRYDADTYDSMWPRVNKAKLTIKVGNGLCRQETELYLTQDQILTMAAAVPNSLFITKHFTIFDLGNGLKFEFSAVDPGLETGFLYGEIEFPSIEVANGYNLPNAITSVMDGEVTGENAYQMKNYWRRTRLGQ